MGVAASTQKAEMHKRYAKPATLNSSLKTPAHVMLPRLTIPATLHSTSYAAQLAGAPGAEQISGSS